MLKKQSNLEQIQLTWTEATATLKQAESNLSDAQTAANQTLMT